MNCRDHEDALFDLARGIAIGPAAHRAAGAHLGQCGACRSRLDRERALSAGLQALARSSQDASSSDALAARLLDAFDARHAPVSAASGALARGRRPSRVWLTAAAAVLFIAAGLTFLTTPRGTGGSGTPEAVPVSEFVPWPGAAALPAFESGQLVRTELPASTLTLLGLTPEGTVTGNTVMADVLVGQDGLARAVRLARF